MEYAFPRLFRSNTPKPNLTVFFFFNFVYFKILTQPNPIIVHVIIVVFPFCIPPDQIHSQFITIDGAFNEVTFGLIYRFKSYTEILSHVQIDAYESVAVQLLSC